MIEECWSYYFSLECTFIFHLYWLCPYILFLFQQHFKVCKAHGFILILHHSFIYSYLPPSLSFNFLFSSPFIPISFLISFSSYHFPLFLPTFIPISFPILFPLPYLPIPFPFSFPLSFPSPSISFPIPLPFLPFWVGCVPHRGEPVVTC